MTSQLSNFQRIRKSIYQFIGFNYLNEIDITQIFNYTIIIFIITTIWRII